MTVYSSGPGLHGIRIEKATNFDVSYEELGRFLEKSGDCEMTVERLKALMAESMGRGEFWTIGDGKETSGFFLESFRMRNTVGKSVSFEDFSSRRAERLP